VLLIGGIPIAMPTVLSVTLAVGAQQLAKHKAIVTRITAIEEVGICFLCFFPSPSFLLLLPSFERGEDLLRERKIFWRGRMLTKIAARGCDDPVLGQDGDVDDEQAYD
jgi:hypothetical protein